MSESTIVTIVVALLSLLGGAGFWGYMTNRKEAPIKKRDADIAVAHASQQMALAVAEEAWAGVGRVRTELDEEREKREALGTEVKELRGIVESQADTIHSLRRVVQAFKDAWANLESNWQILRLQETAPQKPYIDLKEEE
jgi:hypothetical protein